MATARALPDDSFDADWDHLYLPDDMKQAILRTAVAGVRLRRAVPHTNLPLHGILLFAGPPGVGKTTLARGVGNRVARACPDDRGWAFIEIDAHDLSSGSLGRSQQRVTQLFDQTLAELAAAGPLVILIDEVETIATARKSLSMDANPIDVHRAVDAALVGLDRLARRYPEVLILATTNFPQAVDDALSGRADRIVLVPLPDDAARGAILTDTIEAVTAAFPGARNLLDPGVVEAAVELSAGLDGRRLRKAVAAACAVNSEAEGDPDRVRGEDLLFILEKQDEL